MLLFTRCAHSLWYFREEPSIKNYERNERKNYNMSYIITGPSQRRPSNFNEALLLTSFKKALLVFLKNEWTSDSYAPILEDHKVYFALEESWYLYTAKDGHVEHVEVSDLQSTHEEADSRVIFHAKYISEKSFLTVIVVWSSDTDVFILLLYHSVYLKAKIWMDSGLCSKNTRRNKTSQN